MYIKKSSIGIILILLFLAGLSIGSVFASDNSNFDDNLTQIDETDSIDSLETVSEDNGVNNLNKGEDSKEGNELSLSQSDSSEILSVNVNSQKNVLSSSKSGGGHVYHISGYKFKVSDKIYSKIQDYKKNEKGGVNFKVKTNKYQTFKVPKYKNKKVTKYKWKYKKVRVWKYDNIWGDYKSYKLPSKYRSWKYVKDTTKTSANGQYTTGYHVFKKKVKYTATKKVKTGYKKVKVRVYAIGHQTHFKPYVAFRAIGHGINRYAGTGYYYPL